MFSDAILGPGIRNHFRLLRNSAKNCLFAHMEIEGKKDNTIFLRLHRDGPGTARVAIDFAYFLANMNNHEFVSALQIGLYDLKSM